MSATLLDERRYRELLDVTLPVAIRTEEEYHRLLNAAAALMEKQEAEISEEEGRLLEMLSILIDEYENRAHPLPEAEPHKMLAYLLKEKDMKPATSGRYCRRAVCRKSSAASAASVKRRPGNWPNSSACLSICSCRQCHLPAPCSPSAGASTLTRTSPSR
jgi:hypothetical protein